MSVTSNPNHAIALRAAQDLSALQYRVIELDGTLSQNSNTAIGILQNKPQNGEDATVSYLGHFKARVGGAVVLGSRLTVAASGWLAVITSGDGVQVGRAMAVANSGGIVEGLFNFISANTTYDQQ